MHLNKFVDFLLSLLYFLEKNCDAQKKFFT